MPCGSLWVHHWAGGALKVVRGRRCHTCIMHASNSRAKISSKEEILLSPVLAMVMSYYRQTGASVQCISWNRGQAYDSSACKLKEYTGARY